MKRIPGLSVAIFLALIIPLLFGLAPAFGSTLHTDCLVLTVHDGDSMRVQCRDRKKPTTLRLAEVDAPEVAGTVFGKKLQAQPWGAESRDALRTLCLRQHAIVRMMSVDRYKRTLSYVMCQGVSVNYDQIKKGNGWAYFPAKDSPANALQGAARLNGLGLWALPDPVKPSDWRKR